MDEKTFDSCETCVFCSVENGRATDRRGQKVIAPNWQKKKKKNYGAFNDSMQQLESSKGATTI